MSVFLAVLRKQTVSPHFVLNVVLGLAMSREVNRSWGNVQVDHVRKYFRRQVPHNIIGDECLSDVEYLQVAYLFSLFNRLVVLNIIFDSRTV